MGCGPSVSGANTPRKVGVGDAHRYAYNNDHTLELGSQFGIGAGHFNTKRVLKRTESPPETLKLCTAVGQGDRQVTLKLFRREALEENLLKLETIVDAVPTAARLNNHYLLRLFHAFHSPTFRTWYLATSVFVVDVVHLLKSSFPDGFETSTAERIAVETALALDTLHKQDLVHGEFRAANVLVVPSGHVRVSLFPSTVLSTGPSEYYALDSVLYDAPRYERETPVGGPEGDDNVLAPPDDWWAFGCVVYELLCGKALFRVGANENALEDTDAVVRAKNADPVRVAALEKLPEDSRMYRMIQGLLMRDPQRRFGADHVFGGLVEGGGVDMKRLEYYEDPPCFDMDTLRLPPAVLEASELREVDDEENWELEVALLDKHHQSDAQAGLAAVLMGVLAEDDNSQKVNEITEFDELSAKWDCHNTVDKLKQFSINLKQDKFDKFVAYDAIVKNKTGRELDAENVKQFELLKATVEANHPEYEKQM